MPIQPLTEIAREQGKYTGSAWLKDDYFAFSGFEQERREELARHAPPGTTH